MSIYVKHEGTAVEAVPYVKHNGEVKIPTSGWTKVGGELKQIWPPTDMVYIYDEATLAAFRDRVNNGETSLSARVTADITLNGFWTPIASYSSNSSLQYTGTFDGGGYTITWLRIDSSDNYQGLFGYIGTGGTVKNVKLAGTGITANRYVGAIAGWSNGTVTDCINEGDVTATDTLGYAGGIVGYNSGGTVTGCTNSGTVTASGSTGYAGGIVGDNVGGTVSGNTNTGDVTGSGNSCYTGGIAGNNRGSGIVSGNTNTGNVAITGSSGYAGGIVGYNFSSTVENNINIGDVAATGSSGYAGGIVGDNLLGTVSGNTNTGTVTGTNITSDA